MKSLSSIIRLFCANQEQGFEVFNGDNGGKYLAR